MKKMIATLLAGCLVFGTSACGDNTSNSDNTNVTSNTNSASSKNNTLLDDEYYNYGTKALNTVDQYLDAEIEKDELYSVITGLQERIGESEDYGIETLDSILGLLEMSLDDDDLEIDEIREYRDDLASLLQNPLRYRETAEKAFDITSKDFFDTINKALKSIDASSLVLDDFEKIETETSNYFPISFYTTTRNNISVQYQADNKTDKLISLLIELEVDKNNINNDDLSDLGIYVGAIISTLETNADTNKLIEKLDFTNFSEDNYQSYDTDNVHYMKLFTNGNLSLMIYAQ